MKRIDLSQDWNHLKILCLSEVNIQVTKYEECFHHLATTERKIRCGRVTQ
jgi:hypothetical protein